MNAQTPNDRSDDGPDDKRSLESLSTALARTATHLAAEPLPPALWDRVSATLADTPGASASPARSPAQAAREALRRRALSLRAWWGSALAAAAVAAVAALVFVNLPRAVSSLPDEDAPMSGFLTLASGDRLRALEGAGGSQAWIVPTELRRADLASLGLPFDPSRAGDSIRAEVLVQASGEVIAVRLLPRLSSRDGRP